MGKKNNKVIYNKELAKAAREDKEKRETVKPKTGEEKAKERKQRRRRLRIKVAIYTLIGFLSGGAVTYGGNKLLNPPVKGVEYDNAGNTEINLDEIEGELEITGSKAKDFREEMLRAAISEDARDKAEKKIKEAENSEQALDIVKEVVEEYWEECYGEEVTDVTLNKITDYIVLYDDVAENGDKIIREKRTTREKIREEGYDDLVNSTLVTVRVSTDDGKCNTEQVTPQFSKYYTVYGSDEIVEKYEDSKIIEIAGLVQSGIEYAVGMEQNQLGNTSDKVLLKYERNLKNELAKYYQDKFQDDREDYFEKESIEDKTVQEDKEIE